MLGEIGGIVVNFVGSFFVVMLLMRFYFQWLRVPFRNQIGEFVIATTNWAVMPARKVIPPLLALLLVFGGRDLSSAPGIAAGLVFSLALVDLLELSVKILLFVVILQAALSWVNPDNPMQYVLDTITRPLLRPLRRLVPPIARVDLSPLVLILLLLVLLVPIAELRRAAMGIF